MDLNIKNTILIIQLLIFLVKDNKITKITNFKINEVPKATIFIQKKCYKVISGIFHHGEDISHGHYTNMLREEKQWFQINDSKIKKACWPKSAKNVYVLFLERTEMKN